MSTWAELMEAQRDENDQKNAARGDKSFARTGDHCFGHTEADLHAAFDLVKNQSNWKLPVKHNVPADADKTLICDATIYFAGSESNFITEADGSLTVVASGYYNEIGS